MARKKRQKGPAKPHKKTVIGSPKDLAAHRAREAAAKKRRRQPKGTPGGGRFASGGGHGLTPFSVDYHEAAKKRKIVYRPPGFQAEGRSGYAGERPAGRNVHATGAARKGRVTSRGRVNERGGNKPKFQRPSKATAFGSHPSAPSMDPREIFSVNRSEATSQSRRQLERDAAYYKTRTQTGASEIPAGDLQDADIAVSHHDVREAEMARREQTWKTARGVYEHPNAKKGKYIPPSRFIKEELPPSHVEEVNKALQDPNSWLNKGLRPDQINDPNTQRRAEITLDQSGRPVVRGRLSPAVRRRLEQYTQGLQRGESHPEIASRFATETRGRKAGTKTKVAGARTEDVKKSLDRSSRRGRRDKYKYAPPKSHEIRAGLNAQHVSKISDLADQFPDMSERDLIRLQQGQKETIWKQQLENNARWAQETRANNATGNKLGAARDPNRVVFFTTSLGHPAPSVPSDSLIGQYIIRRRKNMLLKEGVVNARDVEGKFPAAVRDMHIIEAGTGVSFGAQGDVGAFQRTGFRVGTKKSPGYGKPIPVGSQILYDSQGRPIYDDQGNVRFTEGATRRFDVRTPDLGFRVFLG